MNKFQGECIFRMNAGRPAGARPGRTGMRICLLVMLVCCVAGCQRCEPAACMDAPPRTAAAANFEGLKAGAEREVAGVKLCWCPAGHFVMGSPPTEPERRPGEDQVEVALSKGFWMGKFEVTQGQWK